MSLRELFLWNTLYWILYLPLSMFLLFLTGQGDPFGIMLIGALCTVVLNVYLALTAEPHWGPAIVHKKFPKYKTKPLEVKTYVKKEEKTRTETTLSARPKVGFEIGPAIRTDVDLSQLNVDDDDIIR